MYPENARTRVHSEKLYLTLSSTRNFPYHNSVTTSLYHPQMIERCLFSKVSRRMSQHLFIWSWKRDLSGKVIRYATVFVKLLVWTHLQSKVHVSSKLIHNRMSIHTNHPFFQLWFGDHHNLYVSLILYSVILPWYVFTMAECKQFTVFEML